MSIICRACININMSVFVYAWKIGANLHVPEKKSSLSTKWYGKAILTASDHAELQAFTTNRLIMVKAENWRRNLPTVTSLDAILHSELIKIPIVKDNKGSINSFLRIGRLRYTSHYEIWIDILHWRIYIILWIHWLTCQADARRSRSS